MQNTYLMVLIKPLVKMLQFAKTLQAKVQEVPHFGTGRLLVEGKSILR